MSYDHSGIRIKEDDIPKLHEKLESIGEEELKKRQVGLAVLHRPVNSVKVVEHK